MQVTAITTLFPWTSRKVLSHLKHSPLSTQHHSLRGLCLPNTLCMLESISGLSFSISPELISHIVIFFFLFFCFLSVTLAILEFIQQTKLTLTQEFPASASLSATKSKNHHALHIVIVLRLTFITWVFT